MERLMLLKHWRWSSDSAEPEIQVAETQDVQESLLTQ